MQSPVNVDLEGLTLQDSAKDIIAELRAQCPPGKEEEFDKLISKIVPLAERVQVSEGEANNEEDSEGKVDDEAKTEEENDSAKDEEESIDEATEQSSAKEANEEASEQVDPVDPVEEELKEYVAQFYPHTGRLSYTPSAIEISSLKQNDPNFWGVSWHSTWTVTPAGISGLVRCTAHYYEDGNVQLHAERTFTAPSGISIRDFIQKSEDSLQMGLNEAYQQLADVSFKRLRRQLPITRQKMDWNKCATYKLSTELKG